VAGAVAAGGVAIAAADLCLAVVSWRRQSVLPGLLGILGIPLVALAIASGATTNAGEGRLATALILTIVGGALSVLGHLFDRLLDDEPDSGNGEVAHPDGREPIPRDERGRRIAPAPDHPALLQPDGSPAQPRRFGDSSIGNWSTRRRDAVGRLAESSAIEP
jgi:hypothetical protein